jgi:uncharacterized protein (TIGR02300 family)
MADKAARGTKRTCQSGACGSRFYDLGRDPIVCPICGTTYAIARGAVPTEREDRRAPRKAEISPALGEAPEVEVEAEDALVDVDGAEEPLAEAEDDTFLEEEEDAGGDVTGIVGGSGGEDEEEP